MRTRCVIVVLGATIPAIRRIATVVQTDLQGPVRHRFHYDRQQMATTRRVELRVAASSSSRLLATVPKGARVEVVGSARDRYLVVIGGRTGWVANSGLTLRHPVL